MKQGKQYRMYMTFWERVIFFPDALAAWVRERRRG